MSSVASARDAWIRRYHPKAPGGIRLAVLPHAGGSASYYFALSAALPGGVEALCVQYPGRQDRRGEPAVTDLEQLADQVADVLEPLAEGPFALFGHSMGATLGFEVVRRLERRGAAPLALFASARRGPAVLREERVHLLDDDGLLAEVAALSGTDARLMADQEIRDLLLPAIRADYTAVETYRCAPDARIGCPTVALVGDRDPRVGRDDARAWGRQTEGAFSLEVFDGGHFYVADHVEAVAGLVGRTLSALHPRPGCP
ncbi:thioesterase II family protein [Kitasatospora sp. NPDC059327]|uniref:thioesterase II family protein n=1 Tax=Kitasatospora sp. NPDC059327 TaxID=3346803 RepID=UPI00367B562D